MIRVTYIYSACVVIETADCRLVCDPWFSEGIYDGSWYHYPPVDKPINQIGKCDFIYVSHIHPDHYDAVFLKEYLALYPKARVLIADFKENFLSKKMSKDGIAHERVNEIKVGQTSLSIVPNEACPDDIDSALVVKHLGHNVVNMNDNLFCEQQLNDIKNYCASPIQIALLGYAGAGPYPQTYFRDIPTLELKAEEKKQQFFKRYRKMAAYLDAKVNIPFAGQYILGGKLARLNPYRGVSDAVEVLAFDPKACVLADGGKATIDSASLKPTALRTEAYPLSAMQSYWNDLSTRPMLYEKWFLLPPEEIPFERLLPKAYLNALRRSHCTSDYYFCVQLAPTKWFSMNANKEAAKSDYLTSVEGLKPRSEIVIDPRYLLGLLTCIFHWNNAEVGSQFFTTRVPDHFDRDAQSFLNFFHL
jgi:UDP-MurNAc hydroxylase